MLTGQLDDGTSGLISIKDRGGIAIVQDPSEATAASMPQSALAHVTVDHCCKIDDMAGLLVDLARDDPPTEAPEIASLTEIENRIAEGIFNVDDWWQLEQMTVPSGLNCPNAAAHSMRFRIRASCASVAARATPSPRKAS